MVLLERLPRSEAIMALKYKDLTRDVEPQLKPIIRAGVLTEKILQREVDRAHGLRSSR